MPPLRPLCHASRDWALPLLGLGAALCLLLTAPEGAPLVALAFGGPRRPDAPGLWDDEPAPDAPTGEGSYDPFDAALGREPERPFENPLGRPRFSRDGRPERRAGVSPSTSEPAPRDGDPFAAGSSDDPFSGDWGWEEGHAKATSDEAPAGNRRPFGARARFSSSTPGGAREERALGDGFSLAGLRLRTSRVAALLVLAGIAASFIPIGEGTHNLAGLLRPIFRALAGIPSGPGLPDLFFLLAIGLTLFDSLGNAFRVIGGTQAAASIRRAMRRGAEELRFDDGDGQRGAIGGAGGLRGILFARRSRSKPSPRDGETER